jgi:hypothetical protein
MASLFDLAGELVGQIPGLPHPAAVKFINKGWQDVRRERLWSFLIGTGELISADSISAGSVAVTKFSTSVVFNATAQVILNPLAVGATPTLDSRQFRVSGGPIYNLVGYDGAGNGTLDRVYTESSNSTATYQVYKCYYAPPSTDFLTYTSILDPINGYVLSGKRLRGTREEIDRRDPLRASQGIPYYLFSYKPDANGVMNHELWPQTVRGQVYLCSYVKKGIDLSTPTSSIPSSDVESLVVQRALFWASRWAAMNVGRLPELRGVNWINQMSEINGTYRHDLVRAKRNDNEIMLTNFVNWNISDLNFLGPIDSNWSQSHDVAGFF